MPPLFPEPAAREARPSWNEVPPALVAEIETLLGEKILGAEIAYGGYSPAADFIVRLARKKVFIKGTHPQQDAHGAEMLRQEVAAYQALPVLRDLSPAYLGTAGDPGPADNGWLLAAFDYIDAAPTLPWTQEKLAAAFRLLGRIHNHAKTGLPDARAKNYVEKFLKPEGGWLRFAAEPQTAAKFLTLFEDADAGRAWLAAALPLLCGLQENIGALGGPAGVLHQDLRSDNILFGLDGRAWLVDWPNACYGPVALDLAFFLPSVTAEGGGDIRALSALYRDVTGIEVSRQDMTWALASYAGHMADNAYRAVPARLPRLRWMQKSILWAMLEGLTALADIPPPPRFKGMMS